LISQIESGSEQNGTLSFSISSSNSLISVVMKMHLTNTNYLNQYVIGTEHLLLVQLDDSSEETSEFFIVGKNSNLTKLRTPRKTKQTSLVSPQSENIDISNHPSSNVFSFQNNQKQMITRIGSFLFDSLSFVRSNSRVSIVIILQ
jgi:Tfp pilus assembly protein PilZ